MKKITFLTLLLFFTFGAIFGQAPEDCGPYQFPNPDFQYWDDDGLPKFWYSFSDIQCDLWVGCNSARENHHNKLSGTNAQSGSGYSIDIYVKSVLFVKANGAISTGRTRVASTTATDGSNYNYDPSGYRWTFNGRPDSISFYAKKISGYSHGGNAYFKVFIHDGNTFKDKADGTLEGTSYGSMLYPFNPTPDWNRFVKKVTYTNTTAIPQLILASFSTGETANVANSQNDHLGLDKLRCIYDKGLDSLKINGVDQTAIKNTL